MIVSDSFFGASRFWFAIEATAPPSCPAIGAGGVVGSTPDVPLSAVISGSDVTLTVGQQPVSLLLLQLSIGIVGIFGLGLCSFKP